MNEDNGIIISIVLLLVVLYLAIITFVIKSNQNRISTLETKVYQ